MTASGRGDGAAPRSGGVRVGGAAVQGEDSRVARARSVDDVRRRDAQRRRARAVEELERVGDEPKPSDARHVHVVGELLPRRLRVEDHEVLGPLGVDAVHDVRAPERARIERVAIGKRRGRRRRAAKSEAHAKVRGGVLDDQVETRAGPASRGPRACEALLGRNREAAKPKSLSVRGRVATVVGTMRTAKKMSISIQPDLLAAITRRAKRLYDGNISAVIAEMGADVKRLEAMDRFIEESGIAPLGDASRALLEAELSGGGRSRKRERPAPAS